MDAKLFRKLEVTKVVSFISYINCIKCYFIYIKNNNLSSIITTRTKCQQTKEKFNKTIWKEIICTNVGKSIYIIDIDI